MCLTLTEHDGRVESARKKILQANKMVEWINFARCIDSLCDYDWSRFNNDKWRPDFKRLGYDIEWLEKNWEELTKAIKCMKDNKPKYGQGNPQND